MSIEEVIQIYDFIGEINYLGVIGLLLLLSPIIFTAIMFVLKDVSWDKTKKIGFSFIAVLFAIAATLLFKYEADSRKGHRRNATKIKNHLIDERWKIIGLKKLDNSFSDLDSNDIDIAVSMFPSEFMIIILSDPKDPNGIKLMDEKAVALINEHTKKLVPIAKSKIKNYSDDFAVFQMSFQDVRDKIDISYDDELLLEMIGTYDSIFIPLPGCCSFKIL